MATALDHLSSQSANLPGFLKLPASSASASTSTSVKLPPVSGSSTESAYASSSRISSSRQVDPDDSPSSTHLSSSRVALLVPPLNFQNVTFGISRSGHPNERNYEFLRRLRLKTILYLATDNYRPSISSFAEQEGIRVLHFRVNVNKEPFAEMDQDIVTDALCQALDKRNYPLLIHCNKGKARVGVLTGLIRRLQGWSHTSIFEEYARFAGTKALDEEFIEVFDLSRVKIDAEHKPDWL